MTELSGVAPYTQGWAHAYKESVPLTTSNQQLVSRDPGVLAGQGKVADHLQARQEQLTGRAWSRLFSERRSCAGKGMPVTCAVRCGAGSAASSMYTSASRSICSTSTRLHGLRSCKLCCC